MRNPNRRGLHCDIMQCRDLIFGIVGKPSNVIASAGRSNLAFSWEAERRFEELCEFLLKKASWA